MKKLNKAIGAMLFILLTFSVTVFAQEPATDLNSLTQYIPESWYAVIGVLIILWDTAALLIPSVKNYAVVGNLLKWISKGGNRK